MQDIIISGFLKHKERQTWEIPGGHREVEESVKDAVARELFEETGAIGFYMKCIFIYSVLKEGQEESTRIAIGALITEFGGIYEIFNISIE